MPRLFLGNFEFEHRLADPNRTMPAKLDRINAELATSWLAIADDGDYLWTPQSIEQSFFDQAVADGLAKVVPVVSLKDVPPGVECVPWGWTDDVRRLCDAHGWTRHGPSDAAVRAANSRRLSSSLEQEWRVGLDFSCEASSIQEIEHFLMFHEPDTRWVIKAEFGMSGRERLIGQGSPTETDRHWIDKRLRTDGVVFFEPWVDRLVEVGIQIDVPRAGDPRYIEMTPLLVDPRGQYAGSRLPHDDVTLTGDWDSAIQIALQAARRIQDLGYFGPLGIDAMQYRDANGLIRIRPLQDINARWTMGRLALGFRRLGGRGQRVIWAHGTRDSNAGTIATDILTQFLQSKQLRLSTEREVVVRRTVELDQVFDLELLLERIESQKSPRISRSTVYRTLSFMIEAGLVKVLSEADCRALHTRTSPQGRAVSTSPSSVGDKLAAHNSLLYIE